MVEYSGLDKENPLDASGSLSGTGTAQSSGAIQVTAPNADTLIGLFGYTTHALPYSAGDGWKAEVTNEATTFIEDMQAIRAGSYTAKATSSNPSHWAGFIVAFRNATR